MSLSRRRFLAASAAVPLFAPSLALAQAKEFRLGLITPIGHSWNKAELILGDDLKAATNGRLTMTVFHSGQLGISPHPILIELAADVSEQRELVAARHSADRC